MTTRRPILAPIGKLGMGALNAHDIARAACLVVIREGRMVVSVDEEGEVFVTPIEHPFTHALMRQYSDHVVGTYAPGATTDDIRGDLTAHWKAARAAAA